MNAKNHRRACAILLLATMIFLIAAPVQSQVTKYTDEAAFLAALANLGAETFQEGFEGAAWESVRSDGININAADSITSNGITWTSGDRVTTSLGAGRNGYGIYAYVHGIPDSLTGTRTGLLFGVGGWVTTNTPFASINMILDSSTMVDFEDIQLGSEFLFYGVIDKNGFKTFEIRETEGTAGDQKFIFADDFTFGVGGSPPKPTGRIPASVLQLLLLDP